LFAGAPLGYGLREKKFASALQQNGVTERKSKARCGTGAGEQTPLRLSGADSFRP
jgi:hypothetical protein